MNTFRAINFFYLMQLEEFLNIFKENIIYKVLKDDQIIKELVYLLRNTDEKGINLKETDEKMDDSCEIFIISISIAIVNLETICIFIL